MLKVVGETLRKSRILAQTQISPPNIYGIVVVLTYAHKIFDTLSSKKWSFNSPFSLVCGMNLATWWWSVNM